MFFLYAQTVQIQSNEHNADLHYVRLIVFVIENRIEKKISAGTIHTFV